MLQKLERLFGRETARVNVDSQILLNQIADRKAEKRFYFLMAQIKQQAIKKAHKQRLRDQAGEEERKNATSASKTQMGMGNTFNSGSNGGNGSGGGVNNNNTASGGGNQQNPSEMGGLGNNTGGLVGNSQANSGGGVTSGGGHGGSLGVEPVNITEEYLVTYREFMIALRGLKNSLYQNLLPRTLSFTEVLASAPVEKDYTISDTSIDDFYMFRYELGALF